MEKLITLRFQAKCKRCSQTIPAGGRAVWHGKGSGVSHQNCNVSIEPPKPEIQGDPKTEDFAIDYSELRNLWEDFNSNPTTVYHRPENHPAAHRLADCWDEPGWAGSTREEMREFIRTGYHVDGLDEVSSLVPSKPRRKLRFAEEGDELHLDLAWAGVDEPFSEWEKRASQPGLSVEIFMTFDVGFPARTIMQYQRWVARALQTLDENGVDMEVYLTTPCRHAFTDDREIQSNTKIRVRNAGEASDFSNWSAMFSPAGFRMLGIMAVGIHADRMGHTVSNGYGAPRDYGSWEVAYDPERNVVVVGNSNSATEFPEFEMTQKLVSVLSTLNG